MWIQEELGRKRKFKRNGLLTVLNLPTKVKLKEMKNNIKINKKEKSINLVEGKRAYALTDKIGISDHVEISLFFMPTFMVIEVQKGCIYLEESDGSIVSLGKDSKITPFKGSKDNIAWKNRLDILDFCEYFVKRKYNLDNQVELTKYINNLIFTFNSSYNLKDSKLFSFKLIEIYFDLGVDIFKYEIKKENRISKMPLLKENSNFKEEDYLREFEKNVDRKVKQSKNLSDEVVDNFDEDADIDEFDELPQHMHEIDLSEGNNLFEE